MNALPARLRRRQSACATVAAALPAYVAGEAPLDDRTAVHVAQCLRCQAEVARYRRMLRTLHALREEAERPPPAVLTSILTGLEPDAGGGADGVTVALVAAAAATVGGAVVLLWVARRRQEIVIRLPTRRAMTKAMTTA